MGSLFTSSNDWGKCHIGLSLSLCWFSSSHSRQLVALSSAQLALLFRSNSSFRTNWRVYMFLNWNDGPISPSITEAAALLRCDKQADTQKFKGWWRGCCQHATTLSDFAHLDNEESIDLILPRFLLPPLLQLLAFLFPFIFIQLFCKKKTLELKS